MHAPIDGSVKLYREIYQETSTGDFGIQVTGGPLFRCHTHVLQKTGGFIGKVRQFGKLLPRTVDNDSLVQPRDYFMEQGYTRLLEDLQSIMFSQPIEKSAFQDPAKLLLRRPADHRLDKTFDVLSTAGDQLRPGYTTAHFIGGTTGAVKQKDAFFLAERYEVQCDCERMAELLRFIYQGTMAFFDMDPRTDRERAVLTSKMLHITFDAERYSVDALYDRLLPWFGSECFGVVGDINFTDAFFHLQHFEGRCTEEHSRNALVAVVTGDMLSTREQFRAVTRDPRWASLPVDFVEGTLRYDGMPISSEAEVLNLIERWNIHADKRKDHIIRLLCCFRPDAETRQALLNWLSNMGWVDARGQATDIPELRGVRAILDGSASRGKKPRRNLQQGSDPRSTQESFWSGAEDGGAQGGSQEVTFVHYRGGAAVAQGTAFSLGAQQRLVQAQAIKDAGIQHMRVALSNPKRVLWDPEHEVFVGLSYGEGRYFGFLCSATAFSGIFSVRALASAAPAPNAPVHFTGSGNKVEFDLMLEVQLQRVNLVVVCKLQVLIANEVLTEELFQIAYETLTSGPGLRFQLVGTGLGSDEIDVQLAWVSMGGGTEEELDSGPLEFKPGD